MKHLARFAKGYAAAVAALTTTVLLSKEGYTSDEVASLVTTWGGVLAVFLFPNAEPEG